MPGCLQGSCFLLATLHFLRVKYIPFCLVIFPFLNFYNNKIIIIIIIIIIITAIGLSPGGSGYFTCTKNMKL